MGQNSKREWLIQIIKESGLSHKELSEKVGITRQYLSYIENNQRCPSPKTAQKLGEFLNFDWTKFFNKEE